SLFSSSVPCPYYSYILPSVKKSVTYCTGRNPTTPKALLTWKPKIFCSGTGRYNYRLCQNFFIIIYSYLMPSTCFFAKLHSGSHTYTYLCTKSLSLLLQLHHHCRTVYPFRV